MSSNLLTNEQQQELIRKMLILVDDFCVTNGIDIDGLTSEEWEAIRAQIVSCYKQCCVLIGDKSTPIQALRKK